MKKSSPMLAEAFYDKIVKLHNEEFNYKHIQYEEWLDLLVSKLDKGAEILDLGCGNGRAIKYLIDKGLEGVGIDVSEKMLELAKKNVLKGNFYKKDFTRLDFGTDSFSAVISFFALNHVEKKTFRRVMLKCKKMLKENGLLLLGMVKGTFEGCFKGFYKQDMQLYGAGYFKEELIEILNSNGFEILETGEEHFKSKYFEEDDIYILAKLK